jgi:hypothetical protein
MVDLLRFRAWHKTWEEMGKVKRIRFDDNGNVSTVLFKGKDFGSNTKIDEIELMQSTGLFDNNGKEIFEGDIVQFEDYYIETDLPYINKGIVEWSQGGFTITDRASVEMEDLIDGEFLDVIIIGNIYENPELLEVTE